MSKRLDQLSKDSEMSVEQIMPALLFAAVPPMPHDNRKSWLARAARTMGWGQRRTKALFYCEARIVTANEWRTINERLDAAKQRERQRDELRATGRGLGAAVSLGSREDLPLPLALEAGTPVNGPKRQA